jgi:ADP-ribose pyrophosphatase
VEPQEELLLTASRFRVVRTEQLLASGQTRRREIVRHPGAVVILPMVDEDHVCLIKNYRVTVGRYLLELPAGTLEPPEPPAETARRELEEETGYRAAEWRFLQHFYLSPGILDEKMHLFVASDLTAGSPHREPGEEIENLIVPWATALEWAESGQIEDAKTLVGLLLGDRLRGVAKK